MQKEMLPYLQKIISLEQAAYVEEKVLDQMKKARQKVDTQKHVISEPVKPRRKSLFSSLIKEWGWFCGGLFIAIVVFVPMLVLTLAEEIGMVDLAPMLSLDKKGYIPLLIIVGLDVFVYLLISISDVSNTNQKLTEEYRKELARYPELVQNKEASYQRALDTQSILTSSLPSRKRSWRIPGNCSRRHTTRVCCTANTGTLWRCAPSANTWNPAGAVSLAGRMGRIICLSRRSV